jgi:hypothetical protein
MRTRSSPRSLEWPTPYNLGKRSGVEVVKLVTTFSLGLDEARILEDVEMLRDGLAGRSHPMPCGEAGTNLEQGLAVPLAQFVQDRPPRRIRKGLVDISHTSE